jgi:hypothetical protein
MSRVVPISVECDGKETPTPDVLKPRRLPSLTALAYLFPLILLYWEGGGPSGLLADPSTGVHVRTGEWILAHHAVPRHDLFFYTLSSKAWRDWEWLSDVIFALAYRLHGLSAVAALSLAILCIISLIVYRTARPYAGLVIAGGVCVLVMATTTIHWLARPHLFTWIGVAALCWALETHAVERCAWFLPVAMVVWVNLHPGFVAGFLVMGAWLAGAWFNQRFISAKEERRHWRREAKWYGIALLLCGVSTLANPYFLQLDRHLASYLFAPSTVTAPVSEWLSPDFHNPGLAWFELLLPLAAAAGVWRGLKQRFHWCFLIFAFMHLALFSVRNVPLFAIVCAAPVAAAGEEALPKLDFWRYVREAEGVARGAGRRGMTLAIWGLGFAAILNVSVSPVRLGAGSRIPVTAIRRLPPGRVFTTDQWADYLIYAEPGRKVFFDGRNDFYGPAFVQTYLTILKAEPGWEQALARYRLSAVLVPARRSLSGALDCAPSWRRLYHDVDAAVFVRDQPMTRREKDGREFQH